MEPLDEKIMLKTGDEVRAEGVLYAMLHLQIMLNGPWGEERVTDLHRLCQDPAHRLNPEFVPKFLQDGDILPRPDASYTPDSETKAVLLAAFLMTPEGVVLSQPAAPTEQNRDILVRAEQVRHDRFEQRLRAWGRPGSDDDTSPGGQSR